MTKIQPPRRPVPGRPSPEVKSETLFGGAREIRIHHAGEVYRLQLTAAGKLLLTK
jgi:hemin uptake protein HemP